MSILERIKPYFKEGGTLKIRFLGGEVQVYAYTNKTYIGYLRISSVKKNIHSKFRVFFNQINIHPHPSLIIKPILVTI